MHKLLFILLFCPGSLLKAQETINWLILQDVEYEERIDKSLGFPFQYPIFGKEVKKRDGKLVSITGYVIPMDVAANEYMLSAHPYNSCYFCGVAGVESIVELNFKTSPPRLSVDQRITVEGVLKLNATDIQHMSYILEEARLK